MLTFTAKNKLGFMRKSLFIKEHCIQKMRLFLNIVIRKVLT